MKNNIKEIRQRQGRSQEWLGEQIGVGKAMVSKLEKGTAKLTHEYMVKISTALECEIWHLTGNIEYGEGGTRYTGGLAGSEYKGKVNRSLDALVELYKSSDDEVKDMFDAVYDMLKNQSDEIESSDIGDINSINFTSPKKDKE